MAKQMTKKKTKKSVMQRKAIVKEQYFDYSLLAVLIFLVCFGLIMLYSTSSYSALVTTGDSMFYLKRQLLFTVAGFIGMFIISRINYRIYFKLAPPIYAVAIFLMFLVKFTPLGKEVNGARRWIKLPAGQQLQPSEIAKIAVILLIPALIIQMGKKYRKFKESFKILAVAGFAAFSAYFFTENLSTAIIIFGIGAVVIFVSHPNAKPYVAIAMAGIALLAIAVLYIGATLDSSDSFRMRRIVVWLQPEEHAAEGGFQVMQGLYAIGSGGLFGKGFGNSTQKMIIPEVQNDMILSVICEELGIFGAIMILLLFGLLLYRLVFIAQNAPDLFSALIVTGIFAHIGLQVILNVAVVTNVIPTTGITLPFVSYGGTSTLFLLAEMGIALGISRKIRFD
ncbi:cell division protein FtsW (lipid II flippase) [Aequitasia blattaphilus]|uniref:Probable peptidoglycan glycosyltransferase FtsW n=1 Tax=Aequitasia blattaphilus TaxID=2949332 RepID=A0ABT1E678_9FIRM|nr:putative peptidoglycan glycosyltransferase FtsW [Aequitasia blattaphilus]MCP1101345.1 putative lipid II flippase FtsW [Aequitasia blattaphilus]MCR8613985.1 putative lipid II flippase FtsW [Aequitasia blattaphilus]